MTTPENSEQMDCRIEDMYDSILNFDPSKTTQAMYLIRCTETWIENHCKNGTHSVKYTQLRGIYQLLKSNQDALIIALPRLVYKEASQDYPEQKQFIGIIRKLMEKAIEENKAAAFIEYLTTIVAYFKFYSTSKK